MPERKRFLDALASLDFKLSVSESVIDIFLQLAHLRVFQIYYFSVIFSRPNSFHIADFDTILRFVFISRANEIGLWSVGSGWVGGHHKLVSVLRSLSTVPLDVPLFKEPVHLPS